VLDENRIRLDSDLTFSDIKGVEVVDLPGKPGEESPQKVQVPEVATTRINSTVNVPDGGSVLLGGLNRISESAKADVELFICLRVIRLDHDTANTRRPEPPKVSETPTGALHFGVGVNSNAGLSGQVVVHEKNVQSVMIDPPTDEEVLKALEKEKTPNKASALPRIERKNVRIHKERISQSTSAPRVYPLLGPAQVHSVRFKCTVYFDDVQKSEWPVPVTKSDRKSRDVFIDKSRVVRVESLPQPLPTSAVVPSA
jgi:hypothetical protein